MELQEGKEDFVDEGFVITNERKKKVTNDPSPEQFWAVQDEVFSICKAKYTNKSWGAKRIKDALGLQMGETSIRKYVSNFLYDKDLDSIFYRSTTVTEFHRKVLSKGELLEEIQKNHKTDHRKSDTVYETLRKSFFPVVRENIRLLFKLNIKCQQCLSAVDLPKTQRTRRPIPATYPNSRWQMDLKKMPPSHGYNYICNIVDCYSRFAFGGCIKHKTAKEVATVILRFIYIFGPPRILQTDNGKEFNNEDLTEVMAEFKTRKINGRPYHPQSQGRVERFNRTVVAYFRTAFVDSRDWPSMLDEFYYKYNSRVNKSTKPLTPYQRFYKRPNFCVALEDQVPICNLTSEEKAFLNSAHLDVEDNVETEELTVENTEVNENSQEQVNDSSTTLQSAHTDRVSIVHVPECAHMDDLSIAPVQERQLSNQEYMENMWRQKLEKIAPVERRSNIYNETPLTDITNSQMVCNTDMMHGTPLTDTTNSQMVRNTNMMHGKLLTDTTNSQIVRNTDMMHRTPLTDTTNSQMVRNTDMTHGTPLTDTSNSQIVCNTDMTHGTPLTDTSNSQIVCNTDMTHGTPLADITNSQMVRNTDMMLGTPLADTTNSQMVRNTDMMLGTPLADITNSQIIRNTDMMQNDVSPYYREIYAKRFLANTIQTNSNKRRYSDSNIYTENREAWDRDLYPVELFPRKSQVMEMQTFNPNINDTIDFRPNSALSAGTNVFLSGYWRKGIVMDIQMDDSKGRVYTVKDLENNKIHCLSKYLIRPNLLY
ncbi:uncharacterized protein [Mytilus edulis]|uniref:uncharacterized protein n=1 Tax=Mytilus edulis TaxID=6550 RepID=UPI0039EE9AAF